jgi:hypothetical protein
MDRSSHDGALSRLSGGEGWGLPVPLRWPGISDLGAASGALGRRLPAGGLEPGRSHRRPPARGVGAGASARYRWACGLRGGLPLPRVAACGLRPGASGAPQPAWRLQPLAPRLQPPASRLQPPASRLQPLACPRSPLACPRSPLASEGLPFGGVGHQKRRVDARNRGGGPENRGAMRRMRRQHTFFHAPKHSLPPRFPCKARTTPHEHRAEPRLHTDESVNGQGRVWWRAGQERNGTTGLGARRPIPATRLGWGEVDLGPPSGRAVARNH